jgi:hypothetical protein
VISVDNMVEKSLGKDVGFDYRSSTDEAKTGVDRAFPLNSRPLKFKFSPQSLHVVKPGRGHRIPIHHR